MKTVENIIIVVTINKKIRIMKQMINILTSGQCDCWSVIVHLPINFCALQLIHEIYTDIILCNQM